MKTWAQRGRNVLRRLAERLPPTGDVVFPGVPNDLFQAHLSLYHFVAGEARGKDVLDAGCGTGYGTAYLADQGAGRVLGVDRDRRLIGYARRQFSRPGVEFAVRDLDRLGASSPTYDLVVSCNVLAQVESPARVVTGLRHLLRSGGRLVVSVPPILDALTREVHEHQSSHRSNLYLWEWRALLEPHFPSLTLHRHLPPAHHLPSFSDPFDSRLTPGDFRFEEIPLDTLDEAGSLAAVFVGDV